jgi:hypothetical protein
MYWNVSWHKAFDVKFQIPLNLRVLVSRDGMYLVWYEGSGLKHHEDAVYYTVWHAFTFSHDSS